jgi:hypothetical protein
MLGKRCIKPAINRNTIIEVIRLNDNVNALSGSMNDQVAPSEADMAQRLQASTPTNSQNNSANTYSDALTNGFGTTSGKKQSKSELKQVLEDRAAD